MRLPPGARPDITFTLRARLRAVVSASSNPQPPSERLALGVSSYSSSSSSSSSDSSLSDPAAEPSSCLTRPPIRCATYLPAPLDPASSRVTAVPLASFSTAGASDRMKLP